MDGFRVEKDSLGEVRVPAGALYGVVIRLGHAYAPDPEQGRGWDMFPYFEYFNLTIYLDDVSP